MTEPLSKITPKDALAIAAGVGGGIAAYEIISLAKWYATLQGRATEAIGEAIVPIAKKAIDTRGSGLLGPVYVIGEWLFGR